MNTTSVIGKGSASTKQNQNPKKKGKTTEKQFWTKYEIKDPSIGSLSRSGKYEFLVSYKPQECQNYQKNYLIAPYKQNIIHFA